MHLRERRSSDRRAIGWPGACDAFRGHSENQGRIKIARKLERTNYLKHQSIKLSLGAIRMAGSRRLCVHSNGALANTDLLAKVVKISAPLVRVQIEWQTNQSCCCCDHSHNFYLPCNKILFVWNIQFTWMETDAASNDVSRRRTLEPLLAAKAGQTDRRTAA